MKFTQSIHQSNKYLYKIKGKDAPTGRQAWWILRVFPDKLTVFSARIKKGHLDLAEYANVLDSGFGDDVPEDILKKHGF